MLQNINSIYSVLISLMLINGLYNLAYKFSPILNNNFKIKNNFFVTAFTFFILINFLGIVTFNLSLFFGVNKFYINATSILIIIFGLYKPYYILNLKLIFKKNNYKLNIIYLLLLSYFVLAVSPITDSDTLGYHLPLPFYILEYGNIYFPQYWLSSQLSGLGETLFFYSLVFNSVHISQILQFVSLLLLVLIIIRFDYIKIKIHLDIKYNISLIILTIPVFIFLISSSKPQLFPIVANFIVLIITFFYLPNLTKKKMIYLFAMIIFVLFCSLQTKFSFMLSSGIMTFYCMYIMIKKKIFKETLIIVSTLFVIIILPREYYEFSNLNKDIIYNFFNPVTDLFGSEEFNKSLRHGTGNDRFYPYWIIIPFRYGVFELKEITYCLGPFVLYFLFKLDFKNPIVKKISLISLLSFIIAILFAQPVGRFYVEMFIWILFVCLFLNYKRKNFYLKLFEKSLVAYSIIFLIALSFFSLNLFKGNFSKINYDQVMTKNADGYLLYKWANNVLPDNSKIISTHRSKAFYKNKVISYEFRLFTMPDEGHEYFIKNIKEERPTYILYSSTEMDNFMDVLKNCRGKLFKFKKNVGYEVGRNPFSNNKKFYDGYIYEFNPYNLENCKR